MITNTRVATPRDHSFDYEEADVFSFNRDPTRCLLEINDGRLRALVLLYEIEVLFLARVDVALQEFFFWRNHTCFSGWPRELAKRVDQVAPPRHVLVDYEDEGACSLGAGRSWYVTWDPATDFLCRGLRLQ